MKKQKTKKNNPKKSVQTLRPMRKSTPTPVQAVQRSHKKLSLAPLATLGPLGYFPKGSGTLGALVALPIAYLLNRTCLPLLWLAIPVLALIGLVAIYQFTLHRKEKDPSCVIIDEVVGQLIPFVVIIPEFMHWPMLFAGFVLFRLFDIFKFGPVAFWDRRKDAIGVMMDDVAAGIIAGFILAWLQAFVVFFYT